MWVIDGCTCIARGYSESLYAYIPTAWIPRGIRNLAAAKPTFLSPGVSGKAGRAWQRCTWEAGRFSDATSVGRCPPPALQGDCGYQPRLAPITALWQPRQSFLRLVGSQECTSAEGVRRGFRR